MTEPPEFKEVVVGDRLATIHDTKITLPLEKLHGKASTTLHPCSLAIAGVFVFSPQDLSMSAFAKPCLMFQRF